jgi:hypothetical protein
MRQDPELGTVRGEAALAKLTPEVRAGWEAFWAKADEVLEAARMED